MARSEWKPPFINHILLTDILNNKKRYIILTTSRSSTILRSFIGLEFKVYTGKLYTKFVVTEQMVGHKFGEFSFTRKVGNIHIKKQNKSGKISKNKKLK